MKSIRSEADLAVNGAKPAFSEPVHVGCPNVGDRDAYLRLVGEIIDRRWLTNDGPVVREFERRVAGFLGVKHCVAMCNGTIALEIAIRALGLKGEVILPSYTFIATAHALHWQGIKPVFADINPVTHNIDPGAVSRAITPRTTGIIGVHLWGRGAPHDELQAIANVHQLTLMYDAAHAFGCSMQGQMIGGLGACEVLSFHATKFFNTFEGGALVTNDDALAGKARLMRNFGFAGYDNVVYSGTNGKMTEVAAAMGLVNLRHLDEFVEVNRRNYLAYRDGIQGLPGLSLLSYDEAERNNYQYVVVEVNDDCPATRDEIVAALHGENILARRYFWPGCHRMSPYQALDPNADIVLPNTSRVAARVVVLPNGTAIPAASIATTVAVLNVLATRGGTPERLEIAGSDNL